MTTNADFKGFKYCNFLMSWKDLKNSISAIFQLLLTWFWPNFKDRFLGPSWTDFNCYGDICSGNICPGDICPYQEYLSWYWPDFDQTLKVGSWDHLEQILTITVKFVHARFVVVTSVHIRNISTVLTLFWQNFQGRFLRPSLTDASCHSDICRDKICPCDICPYQE